MPEWIKPDKPITMVTRRGGSKNTSRKYNIYGDDFLIDRIQSDEIGADLVSMGDLIPEKEWQIMRMLQVSGRMITVYQIERWIRSSEKQKVGRTRT